MIFDVIGMIAGMFVVGYIVFSLVSVSLDLIIRKRLSIKTNLNVSLALSIILVMIIGYLLNRMPEDSFISYVPGLLFMYLYDRRKRLTRKCPHCKERIKLDAVKCKHCQVELEYKEGA